MAAAPQSGRGHLAWVGVRQGKERVYACGVRVVAGSDGAPGSIEVDEPAAVSAAGVVSAPTIAAAEDEVLLAHGEVRAGRSRIVLRRLGSGSLGAPVVLSAPGTDAWVPSLALDAIGGRGAVCAWQETAGKTSRILLRRVDGAKTAAPLFSSEGPSDHAPAVAWMRDGRLALAWEQHGPAQSTIRAVLLDPTGAKVERIAVADKVGLNMAPALLVGSDGTLFVAYHTNAIGDGAPGIPKWIEVRAIRAGLVHESAGPQLGVDPDRRGIDQGFEFPTLVEHPNRALVVFGRGSHCFYRQDWFAAGFAPRIPLGAIEWGCRGRRVAAAVVSGRVVTARRDRPGALLELVPKVREGAPILRRPLVPRVGEKFSRPAPFDDTQPPPRPGGAGVTLRLPALGSLKARAHSMAADRRRGDTSVGPDERVFFGDVHRHSAHSDGTGTADESFLRARDVERLDFAALSDHESFLGKRIHPGEWRWIERTIERFDEPGRFVTLPAYEWTGSSYPGPGHKVVYLPRTGLPIASRDDARTAEPRGLFAALKRVGGFAIPHHIGWTGSGADHHDEHSQPCWEICSVHGCYEHASHPLGARGELGPDHTAIECLKKGLRFGFVAASDSHGLLFHHGIGRKRDPFGSGLTGVIAGRLGRDEVLRAIRTRRCYATSGSRIVLSMRVDDQAMGSVIAAPPGKPVLVEVEVQAPALIVRVEAVGAPGIVAAEEPRNNLARLRWRIDPKGTFVYVRVTLEDGEMAWASPCFFEPPRPRGPQIEKIDKREKRDRGPKGGAGARPVARRRSNA